MVGSHNGKSLIRRADCKITLADKTELLVDTDHTSGCVTVTVIVSGVLDLRVTDLMHRVNEIARRYNAAGVTVDLSRTHRIRDSGVAMLLLLHKKLGQQVDKINVINAGHLMNSGLAYLPEAFEIN